MKDNGYSNQLILDWSRGINGEKNSSINCKYDTCERLGTLIYKSILMAFYFPLYTHTIFSKPDNKSVYNNPHEFFIKNIYDSLILELKLLTESPLVENDICINLRTDKGTILTNKSDILEFVKAMLYFNGKRNSVPLELLDVIDYFDFKQGHSFLKEYSRYYLTRIYNNTENNNYFKYQSGMVCIPVVYRNGFGIVFNFMEYNTGILSYDNNKEATASPFDFISNINIPNVDTDTYLYILASYGIINDISNSSSSIYSGIKNICDPLYYFSYHTDIMNMWYTKDLMCVFSQYPQWIYHMLNLFKNKITSVQCPIGKITNAILKGINDNIENINSEYKAILESLLLKSISAESLSDISIESYSKELDPKSLFYNAPINIWAVEEKNPDEELPEDPTIEDPKEEPKEDTPEGEPKEGEEKKIPEGEPKEEETPEEAPEKESTPEDVPEEEEPTTDKVVVQVPSGSYLIKITSADANSFDDYLYRKELFNLLNRILLNPPKELINNNKVFLEELVKNWVFILDIVSLKSIVKDFIKFAPKA